MKVEPYVWWALALALCYALIQLADWYMSRPLTATDRYCAEVDADLARLARHEALVESRLEAIDKAALAEDDEVARLDALYELPTREPAA